MRRFMLLAALCAALVLALAPTAMAQVDYDCIDFTTQEEAQQFLLAGDPYGLDDDDDGMACDNLPSSGDMSAAPQAQYAPTTAMEAVDEETSSTTTTTPLPDTGGPSLALLAGALLIGAGLALRRR